MNSFFISLPLILRVVLRSLTILSLISTSLVFRTSSYPDFSVVTISNHFLIGEFYFLIFFINLIIDMWRLDKAETDVSEITGCSPNVPLLLTYICFFVVTLKLKDSVSVFTFLSRKSWCTLAPEAIWQLALSSVLTAQNLLIDFIALCSGEKQNELFRLIKADLHGTTLPHTTSLQQACDMS